MVDVVVVGGDWTNASLVDNRWSSYFNASGLIKVKLEILQNDNVTLFELL
jgi:hypothetical protein